MFQEEGDKAAEVGTGAGTEWLASSEGENHVMEVAVFLNQDRKFWFGFILLPHMALAARHN